MPPRKIRAGDVVEVITAHPKYSLGKILTVTSVSDDDEFLRFNGEDSGWWAHQFKLVTKETESGGALPPTLTSKDTNPKDAVATKKLSVSTVSMPVLAEVSIGMLEGARKYGRHNYRVAGVRASVYYDATQRHLMQWWEGEDIDPDSGLSHITKAITSLVVLRDAMIQNKWTDDRPPVSASGWLRDLQPKIDEIFERIPTAAQAYTKVAELPYGKLDANEVKKIADSFRADAHKEVKELTDGIIPRKKRTQQQIDNASCDYCGIIDCPFANHKESNDIQSD